LPGRARLARLEAAAPALAGLAAFAASLAAHRFDADDAFISYRYARHWAEGLGPVWNPGERVEGYTNFLWVALLAGGLRLGLEPERLAPALGTLCGAALLVLAARDAVRARGPRSPLAWGLPLALGLSRSFAAWSASGLETPAFALLSFLGLRALLEERARGVAWPWRSPLLLALATLTRPDGGLFALAAGLCALVDAGAGRRRLVPLARFALLYAIPVCAHALWRHHYYGFWLPNTFYAKVGGLWPGQGAFYLALFLREYSLHAFLPLAAAAPALRRELRSALFAAACALQAGYLLAIGGDYLEFRFLVPLLPLLYWLVLDGAQALGERAPAPPWPRWLRAGLAWAAGAALLAATAWGSAHTVLDREGGSVGSLARHGRFTAFRIEQGRGLRALVDAGLLPRELRIQTGAAGALPYYTGWYTLDARGLNDVRIAHEPLPERGLVAHEREASLEYTRERRIAAIVLNHQLLYEARSPWLAESRLLARRWARDASRRLGEPGAVRARCLEVGAGKALLFATLLDDAGLEGALGPRPECP
jgi:hypothetical protein